MRRKQRSINKSYSECLLIHSFNVLSSLLKALIREVLLVHNVKSTKKKTIALSVTALNILSENALIKLNKHHPHSNIMSQSVMRTQILS